jgi:hypothetical protein
MGKLLKWSNAGRKQDWCSFRPLHSPEREMVSRDWSYLRLMPAKVSLAAAKRASSAAGSAAPAVQIRKPGCGVEGEGGGSVHTNVS